MQKNIPESKTDPEYLRIVAWTLAVLAFVAAMYFIVAPIVAPLIGGVR